MIANRYPCAVSGTVLGLVLLFGSTPTVSAVPNGYPQNPNTTASIEQVMQQMVTLFPNMTPQEFAHLQMALNQMLYTLPNDPYNRNNMQMGNMPGNRNFGNPYQGTTPFGQPMQQNSLFPGYTGVPQNTMMQNQPGFNQGTPLFGQNNQARGMPNQANTNQRPNNQQFQPGSGQNHAHNGNCHPGAQQHHHHKK